MSELKPPPGFVLDENPTQPGLVLPPGFKLDKQESPNEVGRVSFKDEESPVGDLSTWESFKTNFNLAKDNIEKSTWEGLQNAARHEPGTESIGGIIQSAAEKLGDPDFFEKRILDNDIDIQESMKKLQNQTESGTNLADAVMNPHDFWGRQLGETLGGMAGLIAMPLIGGAAATAAVAGGAAIAGATVPVWATTLIAGIAATAASRPFESSAEAQQTYLDIKENLKQNQATNKLTDQQIDQKAYEGFNQTFSENQQLQVIDAAQIGLSIIPLGRLIKPLAKGRSIVARAAERAAIWSRNNAGKEIALKTAADMITEGWEEGRQEQIQRESFNAQVNPEDAKPSSWTDLLSDPSAMSQIQGGMIGGMLMGGGLSTLGHFADKVGILGKQAEKFTEAEIKDKQKHMRGWLVAKAIVTDTELDLKAAVDKYAKTGLLAPDPKASKEERIKESIKEGKNIIKEFEEHYEKFSLLQKVKKGVKDQDNLVHAYKNEMHIDFLNDEITKLGGPVKEKEVAPGEKKEFIPHEKDIKERMGIIEKLQQENERIYKGEDVIGEYKKKKADEIKAATEAATKKASSTPETKKAPTVPKEPEETKVKVEGAPESDIEVKPVIPDTDGVKISEVESPEDTEIKTINKKEGALEVLKGKAEKAKHTLEKLKVEEEENDAILKDLSAHVKPEEVFKDDIYADDNSDFVQKIVTEGKKAGAEENDKAFAKSFEVHSQIKNHSAPLTGLQATTIGNLMKIKAINDTEAHSVKSIGQASKLIQLALRRLYYARENALKEGTSKSIQEAENYKELIKHINKVDTITDRKAQATVNATLYDKIKLAETAKKENLESIISQLSDTIKKTDDQRTKLVSTGKKRDLIKADLYSEYLDAYDNALVYLEEVYKERFGEKETKKGEQNQGSQAGSSIDPISDAEFKEFTDNGTVSEDTLKSIAGKISKGESISVRETAILGEFGPEIEDILQEIKSKEAGKTKKPVKTKKKKSAKKPKREAYKSPTQREIQEAGDDILEKYAADIQKEIQEREKEGSKTKLLSNVLKRITAEQEKRKSKKSKPEKKNYTREGEINFRDLLEKAKAKLNKKGSESLSFAIFRDLMHMALTTKLSAQDGIEMLDAWIGIAEKEFPENAPTKKQVEAALYVFKSDAYPALQRLKVPFDVRSTEYDFSKFLIGRKGLLGKLEKDEVDIYETRLKQAAADKKAKQGKLFMNGVNLALLEKYAWKLVEKILEGTLTAKQAIKQLNEYLQGLKKEDGATLSQMENAMVKATPEYKNALNHIQQSAHTKEVNKRKTIKEQAQREDEKKDINSIDSTNTVEDATDTEKKTDDELNEKGENREAKVENVKGQIREVYTKNSDGKPVQIHDSEGYVIPERVIHRILETFSKTITEENDLLFKYSNIPGQPEISKFIEENATEASLWSLHNYLKSLNKTEYVYVSDMFSDQDNGNFLRIFSSNESISFDDSVIGMLRTFDRFIQNNEYEKIFKENAEKLREKYYKINNELKKLKTNEEKEALVKKYFESTAILLNRITGISPENFYHYMMEDKKMGKNADPHANGAIKFYKTNGSSNVAKFLFSDFNGLTKAKDFIDRMVKPGKGGFSQITAIETALKKNKKVMVDRFKGVTKKQKSSDIFVSRLTNELKKITNKKTQDQSRNLINPWVKLFQHRQPKIVYLDGFKDDTTKNAEEAKALSPDTMFLVNLVMFQNNELKVPNGRYLQRYEQQADESSKIFLEAQKYSTEDAKSVYAKLVKDYPRSSIPSISMIENDIEAYKSRFFNIQRRGSGNINFNGKTANQVIEQWVWNFVINKFMQDQYINPEYNTAGVKNWKTYLGDKVKRKDTANGVQLNVDYLRSVYEERLGRKLEDSEKDYVFNLAIINDPVLTTKLSKNVQFKDKEQTDGIILINPNTAKHIATASGSILNYDEQIKSYYSDLDYEGTKTVIKGNSIVLTPELAVTFSELDKNGNDVSPLTKILDWMEKYDIDHVALKSTAKQGSEKTHTIIPWNYNEDGSYNITDDLPEPKISRMNAKNYVIQQDLRNKDYLHLRKDVRQRHYFNMQYKQGEAIQKLFNQAIEKYVHHVIRSFQTADNIQVEKEAKTMLYRFVEQAVKDNKIKFKTEGDKHSLIGQIIKNKDQKTELGKELRSQYEQELSKTTDQLSDKHKRAWLLSKIKKTKSNEAIRAYIESGKSLKAPYIEDAINNIFKNVVEEEILGLRIFGASAVAVPNFGNKLKTIQLSPDKKTVLPGETMVPFEYSKKFKVGEYIFVTRVPSTGAHSTAMVQIKGFLPKSAGNIIVTDTGTQLITGEDFDGDARYIWGKFKDKEGNEIKDDTWRGLMNKAFDLNVQIYSDPANFDSLIRPIDTKKSAKHIQAIKEKEQGNINPYLPSSVEKADNLNAEGSTVIGILARNQAAYAFIKKLGGKLETAVSYIRKNDKGEYEEVTSSDLSHATEIQDIIDEEMSNNLNHATDNGKENNLAYLGLVKSLATFKTYLLAIGIDPETATMYCNHPVMKEYMRLYVENRAPYNRKKGNIFFIVAESLVPGSTKPGGLFERTMKLKDKNVLLSPKTIQAKSINSLSDQEKTDVLKWLQYNMKNADDFYKISEIIKFNEDGLRNFAELFRASKMVKMFTKPGTRIVLPGIKESEFFKPGLMNIGITDAFLSHQIAYSTKAQKIFETVLSYLGQNAETQEDALTAISNGIKNYIVTEALNISEPTETLKEKAKYFYDSLPPGSLLTKYLSLDRRTGNLSLVTEHRRTKLELSELIEIKEAMGKHLNMIKNVVSARDLMAYHYRIFGLGDATSLYGGFSHLFTDNMVDDLGKKVEKMHNNWIQAPYKDVVENIAGQIFSKMPEEWQTVDVVPFGSRWAMIDDMSEEKQVRVGSLPLYAYAYINDIKTVLRRIDTEKGQYFEIDEEKTKQANRSSGSVESKLNYKPIIDDVILPEIKEQVKGQEVTPEAIKEALKKFEYLGEIDKQGNFTPKTTITKSTIATEAIQGTQKSFTASEATGYSGAADGADKYWSKVSKEYGVGKFVDYVVDTLKRLTPAQYQEAKSAYKKAADSLKRVFLDPDSSNPRIAYAGKLMTRDYLQAKAGDAVFAVSDILNPGEQGKPASSGKKYSNETKKQVVDGGTGYAVEMAIQLGKPVYVFHQGTDPKHKTKVGWYTWNGKEFVAIDTPVLTKKFAGVGTRHINKAGEQAIRDVYSKTFDIKYQESSEEELASTNQAVDDYIQEQLSKMYPNVKVFSDRKKFQEYIDKNYPGQKVSQTALGAAIGDAVFIDPNKAVQSTRLHEHAHLYWDALPNDDRTKKALLRIFGSEEAAIQAIGEAGVSLVSVKIDGSKLDRFKSLLRMFWAKIKVMFGMANEKELAKLFAKRVLTNKDKVQVGGSREIKHQLDTNKLGRDQKRTAISLNKFYNKLINAEGNFNESPQNSELVGVKTIIKNHRGEIDTSTPEDLKNNPNIIWGEVFDDIATQITSGVARKDITQKPDKPVVPDKILDSLYKEINDHIQSLKKTDIDIPVAQIPVGSSEMKAIGYIDIGVIHDDGKMTIRDFKASRKSKVGDTYKGIKKEDDTMQQIIYKIMLESEDPYYKNNAIDVESIGIIPINYDLDDNGVLISANLEPEVILRSSSYEINTAYQMLKDNSDRVYSKFVEGMDTRSILTIEQYVSETANVNFQGLKDQIKAMTAELRKDPEPGETAAAVRKKNGLIIKNITSINNKIGKFTNQYKKYISDLAKINEMMNMDLESKTIEELEEMQELIKEYDNLAAGVIFSHGEKGISVAILNTMAAKQAALTGVSVNLQSDLKRWDDLFLAISDMRDYLPAHQLVSRRYMAATTAAEMEYEAALKELTPLAKRVIEENSKHLTQWTKIKNRSSIPFVSSKSNEMYFVNEYKPDGNYRDPDEKVAPYKKGSKTERMDSLTDAEREHLRAVLKWKAYYKDQQNLAQDIYTQRKYTDFQAVHISKSFAENLASGKNGVYKAFAGWMSSGKDIHQIKLSYQDPRNSSSPRVLRSYSDIIDDLDKAYGDGFISNVVKSYKLFYYMRRAMKAMNVGFHENVLGGFNDKDPITSKEVHYTYKVIEGKTVRVPNKLGSKRTMNIKRELVTSHNYKESENAEFTYDTHRAIMKYIGDMAYVKHVNPLVPTITSLQAIEQIRKNRPNLTKWMNNFVSTELLEENKITFGNNADTVLSVLRAITYYSVMTFNYPLGIFNILTGSANTVINRGTRKWLKGAKLMTNPKEWKRANGILKHYAVVTFKDEPDPNIKLGDVLEFIAIGLIKHGERFIQGSAFLGELPKEVYENFDKEGNIIDQSKELSADEVARRRIKVSDIQGKYAQYNKRFYRANALWALIMQFKTWLPDYINTLFKEKQKTIYGEEEKGYLTGMKDVVAHTYKKYWLKQNPGPLTATEKEERIKSFRAMVLLGSLFSLWAITNGDDDDKYEADQIMKFISQVFAFVDPMSIFSMTTLPAASTAKNILSALGSAFSFYDRNNEWGKKGDWEFLDKLSRVIPYNKMFTAEPIGLLKNSEYAK